MKVKQLPTLGIFIAKWISNDNLHAEKETFFPFKTVRSLKNNFNFLYLAKVKQQKLKNTTIDGTTLINQLPEA